MKPKLKKTGDVNRLNILSAIASNPGICKSELCQVTGLAWGTIGHHTRILLEDNQIRASRDGRKLHFSSRTVSREELGIRKALRSQWSWGVLEFLAVVSQAGASEIARELNVSAKTIARTLSLLTSVNVVVSDGKYHSSFELTPIGLDRLNESEVLRGTDSTPSSGN
jgi:predicted transcriptional regulator